MFLDAGETKLRERALSLRLRRGMSYFGIVGDPSSFCLKDCSKVNLVFSLHSRHEGKP